LNSLNEMDVIKRSKVCLILRLAGSTPGRK